MNRARYRREPSVRVNMDSGEKTWLTPIGLIRALGHFDTDPCCPDTMPWKTADRMITKAEDGLKAEWKGRIWLNPPYRNEAVPFLRKMSNYSVGGGVALIFARTDNLAWHECVFPYADAVFFIRHRIRFCRADGTPADCAAMPSALVCYSEADTEAVLRSGINGFLMKGVKHA